MKKSLRNVLLSALALTLAFSVNGFAQTPSLTDTVWLTIDQNEGDTGVQDGSFAMHIWLSTTGLSGGTLGFRWSDTANWKIDSGTYGAATAPWEFKPNPAINDSLANLEGAAVIGGAALSNFTPAGSMQLFGTMFFSLKAGNTWGAGSMMSIDSSFVPPGGDFLLISPTLQNILPTFLGAIVVTFNDVLIDDGGALPTEFALEQNYPNPFNPETKIRFSVPEQSAVLLEVYNILGQRVKTLVAGERDAGRYEVTWSGDNDNGSEVASGVYFTKLRSGDVVKTRKMMLMR